MPVTQFIERGYMETQRLSVREKIGYGLGDTASNIVFQAIINFMMNFYTDVFGITAAAVGTLMLVVRVFDMFTDPIMGGIADRTETRWGKYRPYLIWTSIPYAILAVLVFTTPDLSQSNKLIYAYITYALLMTAYTAVNIPYSALGGVITGDSKERAEIQAYRFVMAMVGGFIVSSSMLGLVAAFGQGNDARGYQLAMVLLAFIALVCFVLCFLLTRERVPPTEIRNESTVLESFLAIWIDLYKLLVTNSQWAIQAAIAVFLLLLVSMRGSVTLYYTKYYLVCESPDQNSWMGTLCEKQVLGSTFLTLGFVAAALGAATTIFLSRRFCKVSIFRVAGLMIILSSTTLYFIPKTLVLLSLGVFMSTQYFQIMLVSNMFAMVADTVDYGEYKTGRRVTAMTFSAHLFALKAGLAIGGACSGWMLAWYGYAEAIDGVDQTQTEQALHGILIIFSLVPAGLATIVGLFGLIYKLDDKTLAKIQAAIQAQKSDAV